MFRKLLLIIPVFILCSFAFAGTLYTNPQVSQVSEVLSCDQSGVTVLFQLSELESSDIGTFRASGKRIHHN